MSELEYLAVLSVVGLFGNTFAVIVQAMVNAHYSRTTLALARSTHIIINNQRTQMLRFISVLSNRIAADNPNDLLAQTVAHQSNRDAERAEEMEG